MMRSLTLLAGCLWIIGFAAGSEGHATEPVRISDLFALRTVESIDVAADGRAAVVVLRSIERAEDDSFNGTVRSHLHVVDLTRPQPMLRPLSFGARRDRAPQFAPNGRAIAFLRSAAEGETAQVHLLSMDGGEARPVTQLLHGASGFAWAPDSRRLIVWSDEPIDLPDAAPTTRAWDDERPNWPGLAGEITPDPDGSSESLRKWLDLNARDANPVVITRLDFQEEQRLRTVQRVRRLHLVDLPGGDGFGEARPIGLPHRSYESAVFSVDGSRLFVVTRRDESVHPDREMDRVLRSIPIDGTEERVLFGDAGWRFDTLRPSRDGTVLAFRAQRTDAPNYRQWQLGVAPLVGEQLGDAVWLTDEDGLDRSVRQVEWLPASMSLLFTVPRGGGFPLMTMGLGLLEPAAVVDAVDDEVAGVHAFAAGAGTIVYAATTVSAPATLRMHDARGDRLIADLNPWVSERRLSKPQQRTITRPDGTRIDYWYMPPIGHMEMSSYPAVLQIHGGPSAMWGPGELSMWHEFQVLCARGYAVVYANPRGSGGYGTRFQRLNHADWGDGPAGDVLAALDHALSIGSIDPTQLFVTGGSYGGYLTAFIVTRDHRFRAAVAQRGVYDLTTFFGEGNAWRLVPQAMGGYPWDSQMRTVLRRESPFTNVHRIRTPLLIMHPSEDLRTGVSQSEMLYRALKVLGVPVEYVRYPGAGHDLSRTGDPRQRMDRMGRIIEFFDRHR